MKVTPLTSLHQKLGAKMAEFAGYNMPIVYSTIREEHLLVRNQVGIFDVSHMGEFIIKGKQALELVQLVTSNDASTLTIGRAQYSCLPNIEGGIVDDLLVYRLDEDQCAEGEQAFMLVVNAANIEKDWNWISKHNTFDARMIDISDHSALLAVQGPKALSTLQKLTKIELTTIRYYHFTKGEVAGISNVLISATGYTGSGGFELYVHNKDAVDLWNAILKAGEEFGIAPVGLGARDTLRLEMGFCLYGQDLSDSTSPLEAGLGWITKTKKMNFLGKDKILALKKSGVSRKLVGFIVDDRRVPRTGYPICDDGLNEIGIVTSGTLSPMTQQPIGMGYVSIDFSEVGTPVKVKAGSKYLSGKIVRIPFVKV